MNSTNLDSIVGKLNLTFSFLGYPVELIGNNGHPFDSHGFKQFCKDKGITYINSPPYNPQSNGLEERSDRTIKEYLKRDFTNKGKRLTMQYRITNFLTLYRNTLCVETSKCLAELIFKTKPRNKLNSLRPLVEYHK